MMMATTQRTTNPGPRSARPSARPASRRAGQKLASGFFRSAPHTRAPKVAAQVTETHLESVTYIYSFAPGCAVAPNNALLRSPVDCAVVAVQKTQETFGFKADSRETVIKNFGLDPKTYEGLDSNSAHNALSSALAGNKLNVEKVGQMPASGLQSLFQPGTVIFFQTKIPIKNEWHLVAGVPSKDGRMITIYNPSGNGGSVTYTAQEAVNAGFPLSAGGTIGKGKIEVVTRQN